MARKNKSTGIYSRNGRFWLKWYLPEHGVQRTALVPSGESMATKNMKIARILAEEIRESGLTAYEINKIRKAKLKDAAGAIEQAQERQSNLMLIKHGSRVEQDYTNAAASLQKSLNYILDDFEHHNASSGSAQQAKRNRQKISLFLSQQNIKEPREITTANIQQHLIEISQQPCRARDGKSNISSSTLNKHRCAIASFCDHLVRIGLLDFNPTKATRGARVKHVPPKYLTDEEVQQAIKVANENGILPEIATALYAGLRLSELIQLKWKHINWNTRQLRVIKSKNHKARNVPLCDYLIQILQEFKKVSEPLEPEEFVFKYRSYKAWYKLIQPLREEIPFMKSLVGTGTGSSWHLFRHTFGTKLTAENVVTPKVKSWMGHTTIITTQKYTHIADAYDGTIERVTANHEPDKEPNPPALRFIPAQKSKENAG